MGLFFVLYFPVLQAHASVPIMHIQFTQATHAAIHLTMASHPLFYAILHGNATPPSSPPRTPSDTILRQEVAKLPFGATAEALVIQKLSDHTGTAVAYLSRPARRSFRSTAEALVIQKLSEHQTRALTIWPNDYVTLERRVHLEGSCTRSQLIRQ